MHFIILNHPRIEIFSYRRFIQSTNYSIFFKSREEYPKKIFEYGAKLFLVFMKYFIFDK